MTDICIIPARGGSKRIPRKNIRTFAGRPMIAWPISVAREAGCFDRIVVSTDDQEIAELAVSLAVEVPFMRPANLADDFATTRAVVQHAIRVLTTQGMSIERVCCLYPTAAFVTGQDLLACRDMLGNAEYVFPVAQCAAPLERALRMTPAGGLQMEKPEEYSTRSQDLAAAYFDAGQFYWGHADVWLSDREIFDHQVAGCVLPRHRIQDIDTPEDWEFAERLFAMK